MSEASIATVGALLARNHEQIILATGADGRVYNTTLQLTCVGTETGADGSESMVLAIGPCQHKPDGSFVIIPKIFFRLIPSAGPGDHMRESVLEAITVVKHAEEGGGLSDCRVAATGIGVPTTPLPTKMVADMQFDEEIRQASEGMTKRTEADFFTGVWPTELLGCPVDPTRPKLLHHLEIDGEYIDTANRMPTEAQKIDSDPDWPGQIPS